MLNKISSFLIAAMLSLSASAQTIQPIQPMQTVMVHNQGTTTIVALTFIPGNATVPVSTVSINPGGTGKILVDPSTQGLAVELQGASQYIACPMADNVYACITNPNSTPNCPPPINSNNKVMWFCQSTPAAGSSAQ